MPAFHVSVNFDIQGPYFVTYPGPASSTSPWRRPSSRCATGGVDVALVGGVAHQRNFLVEHHFAPARAAVPADDLRDAAGCLVLERAADAARRGAMPRARLLACTRSAIAPWNPFDETAASSEQVASGTALALEGAGTRPRCPWR